VELFLIGFGILWLLIVVPMFINVLRSPDADVVVILFLVPFLLVGIGVLISGIATLVRGEKTPAGAGRMEMSDSMKGAVPLVFLMPDGQIGVVGSYDVDITTEIIRDGYSSGASVLPYKSENVVRLDDRTKIVVEIQKRGETYFPHS